MKVYWLDLISSANKLFNSRTALSGIRQFRVYLHEKRKFEKGKVQPRLQTLLIQNELNPVNRKTLVVFGYSRGDKIL